MTLLEPFAYDYMLNAMWVSALIGAVCAFLSAYLMLKGWSLMGDAISHAVLPGIVLAHVVGAPLILGAFLAAMVCSGATGYLTDNSRIKPDTIMGVVFSGMFGLGIVMYPSIETEVQRVHILFGDMLGVVWADVIETAAIAAAAFLAIAACRRDLLLFAFDPRHARAVGLRVRWLHYGLLAAISLVVVGALEAVGLILAIALLMAAPTIGGLLQLALSRAREYDADLDAAGLTGDPEGLASALLSLERKQSGMWEGLFLPGARIPDPSLLRSHPRTEARLNRLLSLRQGPDRYIVFPEERPQIGGGYSPIVRRPRFWISGLWY